MTQPEDAPRTSAQTDRAVPTGRRSTPAGAARGGFTESELALIHATAEANGRSICVCTVVVPDGTFPPTPDGAPRPEVARILASLRRDAEPAPRAVGTGADRHTARSAQRPAASAASYDRDAYDLEASRRLAVPAEHRSADRSLDAVAADTSEAGRG